MVNIEQLIKKDMYLCSKADCRNYLANHRNYFETDCNELAVVLCYFNPANYLQPIINLIKTLEFLKSFNVNIYIAELLCGEQYYDEPILPKNCSTVFHLKSKSTLFYKEYLWNYVVDKVPKSFNKILCLDSDVIFVNKDWVKNIIDKLDRSLIIQPFSHAIFTDENGNFYGPRISIGYAYEEKKQNPESPRKYFPGFGLAFQRCFWENIGGFFNSPVGGGDTLCISAVLGKVNHLEEFRVLSSKEFWNAYTEWNQKVYKYSNGEFGCIKNPAVHLYHGSEKNRDYIYRYRYLSNYNPKEDIEINIKNGIFEWSSEAKKNKIELIENIKSYFRNRNEDG